MIRLRSLYLEPYSKYKHLKLVRKLNEDQNVYDYISKHFDSWVNEPETSDTYEVMKSYAIVNENKETVGMCGSTILDSNGIIDLWCAIDKDYRNCCYGEKLLVQVTEYFLENIPNVNNIKLIIKKGNTVSNVVANKLGYSLVDSYDDKNEYRYFKR